MYVWGITKKYKSLSWWENFMGGHVNIGAITIFGANAMNWTINIRTRRFGYICFTLPALARWRKRDNGQRKYEWYLYISHNATPWACTFYRGSNKKEKIRAQIRKYHFGTHYNSFTKSDELHALNNKMDSVL